MRGWELQGYLANKKPPTPYDHHRALGIGLLWVIAGLVFIGP